MTLTRVLLPVALLGCVVCSCTDDGCSENTTSVPQAGFYKSVSGRRQQVSLTKLTVRGIGAPGDSAIVDTQTVSSVYLPLRLSSGKSEFVFDYYGDSLISDTLALTYDAVPYFVSKECGAMYNFEVKGVTHTTHEIDSVVLPSTMLTNADGVKIRIFVKQ